ncbi:MAG: hypothetical protein LQ352_002144 [Teloschistes flavicans]|nr:MAG: hypothetical protein LQ352_002144 [Teloschistes flavicans]
MDFIEGIGERYLIGKANAVPQQLEGYVKKQLKGEKPTATAGSVVGQHVDKDREIEELRKQLAEVKAAQNNGRPTHADDSKPKEHPAKKGPAPPANPHQKAASVMSGESSRSKQVPSSNFHHRHERTGKHERRPPSREPRRGRSDSIKTAVAARPQPQPNSSSHQSHHQGRAQSSHSRTTTTTTTALSSPKGTSSSVVNHNDEKIYSANHAIAFTTPVYQQERPVHENLPSQHKKPERARSHPDICVVEVTEEEPRRQRRIRPMGKGNFVEVLEKERGRTRYVVR